VKTVCANSLEMPLQAAEEAVLAAFEQERRDPEILEEATARAAARVEPTTFCRGTGFPFRKMNH
jgi:hypothetical protein